MIKSEKLFVDSLFEDAARLIVKEQRSDTVLLQSNYQISYNRAGVMLDELERAGIVSQLLGSKPRDVLIHDETSLEKHLNSLNYTMVPEYIHKTRVLGISRLRMGTDGHGITALVAFHGCPLRCEYCLNPASRYYNKHAKCMLPEDVMEELKKDELYYIATKGGVTFGGGEPLLNSQYIKDILELGSKNWNVTVETSLNVPRQHLELLLPYINEYIVDIKDMKSKIYKRYTGEDNKLVKDNLKWLVEQEMADRIICRVPLIPNYNCVSDQEKSKKELLDMGIKRFDLFTYVIDEEPTIIEKSNNKDKLFPRKGLITLT